MAGLERERVELESELELVRTRATELQEVVNQQRRELVEQRADITTELRLLRELVERGRPHQGCSSGEDEALVAACAHGEPVGSAPDPVVELRHGPICPAAKGRGSAAEEEVYPS